MNLSSLIANYEPQASPFATHLNLLRALGPGIKTVVELGAGEFSTPLFLDRVYYPDLIELVTVEQNREWVKDNGDPRHKIAIVEEPIEPFLALVGWHTVNLVFVDNSTYGERRCDTLRWLSRHIGNTLVVVHDFDVPSYAEAAKDFDCILIDDRQKPWTALMRRKA